MLQAGKPCKCHLRSLHRRFKYEKEKQEAEAVRQTREKARLETPKEVHFNPRIGDHDLETKMKRVQEFLSDGRKCVQRIALLLQRGLFVL